MLEASWRSRPVRLSYELHSYRAGSQTTISYTLEARFDGWKERVLEPLLVGSLFAEMQRDMEMSALVWRFGISEAPPHIGFGGHGGNPTATGAEAPATG